MSVGYALLHPRGGHASQLINPPMAKGVRGGAGKLPAPSICLILGPRW